MLLIMRLVPLCVVWMVCFMCALPAFGQIDKEFWFVVPEIAISHGDRPIELVISALDEDAKVTISLPADPTFQALEYTILSKELKVIDLTRYIDLLENKPAGNVLNKGVFIQSDKPITAYYQVAYVNNQDIYALKGRQALGTEFIIPSQNDFPNIHGNAVFDIVASQDHTRIEISTTSATVGHTSNTPLVITLNRGQTYSIRSTGMTAFSHLGGSRIKSDKPIAVMNSDDSIINELRTGWDLVGDQLVPNRLLGTEYIIVRGDAATERVYVYALENNTRITDGASGQAITLNANQGSTFNLISNALYLKADKPVIAWHLTGWRNEPAGALIPPIGCSGSREVGFVRPFSRYFSMILLTENGNEDAFLIDGKPNTINSSTFLGVIGSQNKWRAARIDLGSLGVGPHRISNSKGLFHMGLLISSGTGCSYGYFSDYSGLYFGENLSLCEGDTLRLEAGSGVRDLLWSTGSRAPEIQIVDEGTYWATATQGGCVISDTFKVEKISLTADLGKDTTFCEYESLSWDVSQPKAGYTWSDGDNKAQKTVDKDGSYWVRVNRNQCVVSDTVQVEVTELPPLDLGKDQLLCTGESVVLNAFVPEATYVWKDGSNTSNYVVSSPGTYYLKRIFRGCFQNDSIVFEPGFPDRSLLRWGIDTTLCLTDTLSVNFKIDGLRYIWENGDTQAQRIIKAPGTYILTASTRCESFSDTLNINYTDCTCLLDVANVITPNGDGVNENFTPEISCDVAEYLLEIFDRWGNRIFTTKDKDLGWNGKQGNKDLSEGIYFWALSYRGADRWNPNEIKRQGLITLMR